MARDEKATSGAALAMPPAWRARHYLAIAVVLVVLAVYFNVGDRLPVPGAFGEVDKRSAQTVFNQWLLLGAVTTSFHLVFGVAGRFAFSTAAFMGLGAFVSHAVTRASGLHWSIGLLAAIATSWVVGLVFVLLVRRAQHFYFAVATLGLAEVLLLVFGRWQLLSGRSSGEITGVKEMTIFGWEVDNRYETFWILLAFLGIVLVVTALIARSPLGRVAIAARDRPEVLETTGVDATRPGVLLFTLGCVVAAVGGSLFVHTRGLGTPQTFGIELGIGVFVALILGGLHSLWGGLIGAWFYVYIPLYLERWQEWTQVLWGAVLVIVMITFPDGLVGIAGRLRSRLGTAGADSEAPRSGVPQASVNRHGTVKGDQQPATAGAAMSVRDITVTFGGVIACHEISMEVAAGEVVGLTGPNGSGKSTLLNAITGLVHATGTVEIDDWSVPLGRPRAARRAGIVRAFQTPQTWDALTCLENAALGPPDPQGLGLSAALLKRTEMRRHEEQRWEAARMALGRAGLTRVVDQPAASLTYGQRRMLELARTIASEPGILLLDEPAAGLNRQETDFLAELLGELRDDGLSLLVVDHKIDFLDDIVDRLVVLQLGRVIATGPPSDVWSDQAVIDAYLGTEREASP